MYIALRRPVPYNWHPSMKGSSLSPSESCLSPAPAATGSGQAEAFCFSQGTCKTEGVLLLRTLASEVAVSCGYVREKRRLRDPLRLHKQVPSTMSRVLLFVDCSLSGS